MQQFLVSGFRSAGLSALLLTSMSHAHAAAPARADLSQQLRIMQQQLAEQGRLLEALAREVKAQRARQQCSQEEAQPAAISTGQLESERGAGNGQAQEAPAAPAQTSPTAAADGPAGRDKRPPPVAPLFEQPGVLTPRGKMVLEPSLQFGYSSSNRVALVGYTVIPALLIGLVDVREVKRNTFSAALTGRIGVSNRVEAELKIPYVYRSDSAVSRELFTGTSVERVFDTRGKGLGDVESALRYQINDGGADKPYYIGGVRFKARNGRDPFSVVTDCTRRCVGENVSGTGLPLDLPTGSGFYSLQPSLTWLFPSDPAVFFGSVSYTHNFKRRAVSRLVLGGEREFLGEVKPGAVFGFNFGIGLALNDKASFSLGYDHSSIARTRQNGVPVPGSVRTQLGTLLLGYSYRLSDKRSLNVAIGAGLTRDTPDVSLTVRIPITF
ncbi:MAG: acetate kinase [Massilia sp.]|nr:acetate kinase [Massilia sp.]